MRQSVRLSYSPSRKVDSGRRDSGTLAESIEATAIAAADGGVDGESIVRDSISFCTVILHIAKDLVRGIRVEGGVALMCDILHPVGMGQLEEEGTHKEGEGQEPHDGVS